ncbi:MAG: cache domain-containing protein [Desulfobacterium sp.]|nr:cache domain-containing protein [Desulfobacterium sp.]
MAFWEKFLNLRIRSKLILSYSVCFALVFTGGSTLIYHQVGATMGANLESELDTATAMILKLVKTSVDLSIKNHLRAVAEKNLDILEYFYQKHLQGEMGEIEAKEMAVEILLSQTIGKTGYIYAIDSRGRGLFHPQKELIGRDVTGFEFINEMIQKKSGYMVYQWRNPSETRSYPKAMYFAYFETWDWIIAVTSYRSEFMDLLDIEDLRESIFSANPGKQGYSSIIDLAGNLVLHPRMKGNLFDQIDENKSRIAHEVVRKKTGKMEYLWQNPDEDRPHKRIATFKFIPEYEWVVVSSVYAEDVFKPLKTIRSTIIFITLAILIVIIGVSAVLAKGMTRSLDGLTRKMEGSVWGRFKGVEDQSTDEMQRLSANLDLFMAHLSQEMENRRRVERSLEQSEERFRAIFNSAFNFIVLLDLSGNIVEVNQTALAFVDADFSEVVGEPFWDTPWWPLADQGKNLLKQEITRCAGGAFVRSEKEHLDRFGKRVAIDYSLKAVVDATGKPVAIVAEGRDFTERKIVEETLRVNEKRHRTILETSPNSIILYDTVGKIRFVNNAFTRVFGWELNEVAGKELDFVPPESLAETERAIRITRGSDTCHAFETRRTTRDGRVLDVSISAAVYRDTDNTVLGTVVNLTDITHIRETHRELSITRNYIKEIIDSMPSVLVGVDVDARVTLWNQAAETFTTIPPDRAKGRLLSGLLPQFTSLMGAIEHAVTTQSIETHAKVKCLDKGDPNYFDIIVYPLRSGGIQGAVVLITDVSQRVFMEEMMIQSEKMLSVGGLAAGMAHEINNPLAGIMQNLQVLISRLRDPLPVNVKTAAECGIPLDAIGRYMEKRKIFSIAESALTAGGRAARIVENMLSFSRKGNDVVESHAMDDLMDATLEIAENDYGLKKKYDFRSIVIQREYAIDLPLVPCERSKIQQVFFNIIKNGAQAMVQEALPEESPPCFTIRIQKEREHVRLEIQDNGPGMATGAAKRIFDPFYTTKDVREGTGLGLSVSYFIITENHGGTIEVASSVGKGTCFTIRLPLERKALSLEIKSPAPGR